MPTIGTPMVKPAVTSAQVTIPAGGSLSNSVNLTAGSMVMLLSPSDWTPADLTFRVSQDNVTFYSLYDNTGREVVRPMGANRAVPVDSSLTASALYVQLFSGQRQNPVEQSAARVFTVLIQ
jgi:hypothetical protein